MLFLCYFSLFYAIFMLFFAIFRYFFSILCLFSTVFSYNNFQGDHETRSAAVLYSAVPAVAVAPGNVRRAGPWRGCRVCVWQWLGGSGVIG
jgi:hypothetical protein